jgi:serine kinase of HPr protein (carbohydrate metabolism regulator)
MKPDAEEWVHATCVVIEGAGVLIRGVSGSGKSTLARRLIEQAKARGLNAALVGDDRIHLMRYGTHLLAEGHPAIRGQIEIRGLGIGQTNVEDRAAIRLLADCVSVLEARLPEAADGLGDVLGLTLRRVAVTPDSADNVLVALGVGPVKVSG